ncbi:hypothetical protein BCR35DRAFT_309692 [Leucosporidium creatinivorum]|uniref:Adenosine deaminase domain-containing protein n=1 Tax=Leucosporidium creatinivorum TaxID=106004 RepID=A0A1Y2DEL7_9BASI|nr:hypothetical protein BCR35DRAFT_309692 [Leucosporidium creatinivorum]
MSSESLLRGLHLIDVHCHLNGSIPPEAIAQLVAEKSLLPGNEDLASFRLPTDMTSFSIHDFFPLFSSFIYRLTSSASSVTFATLSTLRYFANCGCMYIELRTTPRAVPENGMTRRGYVEAVKAGFSAFEAEQGEGRAMLAKLILSIDRRHTKEVAEEVVDLAVEHRGWVVGVDLCGDPTEGDSREFVGAFGRAKREGLGVTVHLGELPSQLESQADDLLLQPDRLGHATFLSPETTTYILKQKLPIEICKTATSIEEHHLGWALEHDLPVLLCTDDPLIFHSPPSTEYSLALSQCQPPRLEKLYEIVVQGTRALFCNDEEREWVRGKLRGWRKGLSE